MLAEVSVDYSVQQERRKLGGASDGVLAAVARARQLDEVSRRPFARSAVSVPLVPSVLCVSASSGSSTRSAVPRPGCATSRWISSPPTASALYAPIFASPNRPPDNARFVFLNDEESQQIHPDWEQGADDVVATLRGYAGKHPHDKSLTGLIGELVTRSDEFRIPWAAQNVSFHRTGIKRMRHRAVDDLELAYKALDLPADPGWHLFAYTAEPGSATDELLRLLASWAATLDQEEKPIKAPTPEKRSRPHSHE